MATYPIKMLRDEERQPFIPYTNAQAIVDKDGKTLQDLMDNGKYKIINNLTTSSAGQGILDAYQGKVLNDKFNNYIPLSQKGVANGVATLGSDGKVPSGQLPSYVDDVLEAYIRSGATALSKDWLSLTNGGAALTPETGKIYVIMSEGSYQNKQYRWGGSTYILCNPSDVNSVNGMTGVVVLKSLTIQKNGTKVGESFNGGVDRTINITVPTNNNELTNGAGYLTLSDVMTGATTAAAGKAGIVPQPSAGSITRALCADGQWKEITTISGNAGSATKLNPGRNINNVLFDGSQDIEIPVIRSAGRKTVTASGSTASATGGEITTGNGISMFEVYGTSNNTPINYGNIINVLGKSSAGGGQLLLGWSGSDTTTEKIYYRSHRDTTTGGWGPWKQIAYTDLATTSSNGLMSSADKSKLDAMFDIVTFIKNLNVTTNWMDTGIASTNLDSGSYIVQIDCNAWSGGGLWYERWTGVMSWYSGGTDNSNGEEVLLHNAGHDDTTNELYIRTIRQSNGTMKLQIAAKTAIGSAKDFVFKFRRMI